jgi:hypothetical protein
MKPDTYSVTIVWSDEDQAFVTEVSELPGCLDELVIKGPDRLTALAKPCSLGQDLGFIGSRVEETEAHQSQVSEFSKVSVKSA